MNSASHSHEHREKMSPNIWVQEKELANQNTNTGERVEEQTKKKLNEV